jgi:hypothetical protein
VKLTAIKAGYFIVSVDGVDVSKHTQEREAIESAVSRVLPGNDVRYRHDYVVVVQAGVVNKAVQIFGAAMQFMDGD